MEKASCDWQSIFSFVENENSELWNVLLQCNFVYNVVFFRKNSAFLGNADITIIVFVFALLDLTKIFLENHDLLMHV